MSRRDVRTIGSFARTLLASSVVAACGDSTAPKATVASVVVTAPVTTLERTVTSQFSAKGLDANGVQLSEPVVWSSSDTTVAKVDAGTGLVSAVARGTTNIRATSGGKFDEKPLSVFILYRGVALGAYTSCDIGSIGVAHCWGANDGLQIGDGTAVDRHTPVNVSGGLRFSQLALEELHTCGVTTNNAAYCWGSNSVGQLGNTNPVNSNVPVAVMTPLAFKAITVGGAHTCALTTGGQAHCWGSNTHGQLGNDATVDSNIPVQVSGSLVFAQIDAGGYFTCGVTTTGTGYCWGSDISGELGNGGVITNSTTDISKTPTLVAGGLTWSRISAGRSFACGVTTNGAGYCWGLGRSYQLGNGADTSASAPVAVSGGLTFSMIESGYASSCGLTTSNQAWCWGANLSGQLGVALPVDLSPVPVRAAGTSTFSELSVGSGGGAESVCAISVDRLSVKCWGRNDYGQLGNGTTAPATSHNDVPVPVTGQQP